MESNKKSENTIKQMMSILENMTEGCAAFDKGLRFLYINKMAEKMLGLEREGILGKRLDELFSPKDAKKTLNNFQKALDSGKPARYEEHYKARNVWFEIIIYPSSEGLTVYFHDITKQKKIEDQKEETTALLESMLYYAPIGFAFFDKEYKYIKVNDFLAKMNGIPKEDHLGKTLREVLPEESAVVVEPIIDKVFKTKKSILNLVISTRDPKNPSNTKNFLTGFYPVLNKTTKEIVYVGAILLDVTQQKKTEKELQATQAQFKALYDSNTFGVIFTDSNGNFRNANEAFISMLGYTKSELLNDLNWDKVSTDYCKKGDNFAIEQIKKKGVATPWEKEFIKKNGKTIPVIIGTVRLNKRTGECISFVLDNSERKKLEKRKDEFIGIASHELKTPLTNIKGYTQILERIIRQMGDKRLKTYLKRTSTYIEQLDSLIGDLLDVSKIQAGKLKMNFTEFSFDDLVNEGKDNMQYVNSQHSIEVTGKTGLTIVGDRHRLEQVLTNLLSNAVKYSPEAEKVIIDVSATNKDITVKIKDYGIGINKSDMEKIFQRFYRVDEGAETFSGLGIGLYISRQIIQRHGGSISVESEIGKGSTFSFTLPLSPIKEKGATPP